MKKILHLLTIIFTTVILSSLSFASQESSFLLTDKKAAAKLQDNQLLSALDGFEVVAVKNSKANKHKLSKIAHDAGKCGGFEYVDSSEFTINNLTTESMAKTALKNLQNRNTQVQAQTQNTCVINTKSFKSLDLDKVDARNIEKFVRWFSSFHTRYHRAPNPDIPVDALKEKIELMLKDVKNVSIYKVSHNNTPQSSLAVTFAPANKNKNTETVVLGGHLDSIISWGFGNPHAPGADDNASGIGTLIEAMRIFALSPRPNHYVQFYFYAGEEAGLLGSREIAIDHKNKDSKIRGVLQLDMTMFPGSGPFTIASMTDFTSPRLRQWLNSFNENILGVTVLEDQCGYGCSDHASWHRQGFDTLMPFEAKMNDMNSDIHSKRDVVSADSNFEHAAVFAKIALAFANTAPSLNCE